jgi:hypothetical protein
LWRFIIPDVNKTMQMCNNTRVVGLKKIKNMYELRSFNLKKITNRNTWEKNNNIKIDVSDMGC